MRFLRPAFNRQVRYCRRGGGDDADTLSLKLDRLDIREIMKQEDPSQPVSNTDVWEKLNTYLRHRSVKLRDISASSNHVKERILEQVFDGDPILVGLAMTEWKLREKEDRLTSSPVNVDRKLQGIQLLQKFSDGIRTNNENLITEAWLAILEIGMHHRLWATQFSDLCKSRSCHLADWAVAEYRKIDRRPDIQMYTSLLLSKKSFQEVKEVLRTMHKEGIKPDERVYVSAMKAVIDDTDAVRYIFSQMQCNRNLKVTPRRYNLMLEALEREPNIRAMEGLWQRMIRKRDPPVVSDYGYSLMIRCRCSNNDIKGAYQMLEQAEHANMTSDFSYYYIMRKVSDPNERKALMRRFLKRHPKSKIPQRMRQLIPEVKTTFNVGNETDINYKDKEGPLKEWHLEKDYYEKGPIVGDGETTPTTLWEVLENAEKAIRDKKPES
eukprot:TRINITY_DN11986_c0_g1_i1.p1 TRINITY_DN11986_c0_g1~~TRINITY_DN11986_c0_g1_i1.p1  ORF type:complete len:437 (+),score=77.58 TRINITY_DN11986_c0_g1_i1:731-2041(+)